MTWTNALIDVLLFFFVIDCLLMILVVLMQRSKQEGLGAAFGGGFTESVWGAGASQALVKATVWFAAIFFMLSISLARLYSYKASLSEKTSILQQELLKPVAPISTNAAAIAPATPAPVTPATEQATPAPVAPAPPVTSKLMPAPASATPTPASSAPATPAKPATK